MSGELQLDTGERVLWTGEPQRHPLFEREDLILVPMSILWTVAVGLAFSNMLDGMPPVVYLFLAFFVGYACYFTVGRLILRTVRRRSTTYTLTDRRIVEQVRRPFARRREVYLSTLQPPVVRADKHGGTGSIAFGDFPGFIDAVQDLALVNTRRNRAPRPLVLHDVAQPDYVRGVIAQARR
ncbi:hypothetical protein [Dactylosporangium sp. NPDC005555]|uniref:hypothetical protein n=1 Tax=Dactylosporangium sp. NPDC005555 TaxID=3154889 RepID=UPI0033A4B0ED